MWVLILGISLGFWLNWGNSRGGEGRSFLSFWGLGLISWCLEVDELLGKMLVECYYAWEGTKGR